MNTLLLDTAAWDLVLDSSGNIALAQAPYALAQDVASAVRVFLGELWYDTTQGVPYFQQLLGQTSLINELFNQVALTVPGVVTAKTSVTSFNSATGAISGTINFTDNTGATNVVSF